MVYEHDSSLSRPVPRASPGKGIFRMPEPIRITVWNEFHREQTLDKAARIYPDGIHRVVAAALGKHLGHDATIRTATFAEPEHGLDDSVLKNTDVLSWWGHALHEQVNDQVVQRVHQRVLEGMGLLLLHSSHYSKIFRKLMGTDCGLRWREAGERERIWCVDPAHPIANGLPEFFEIPQTEMYGEHFDIPAPDQLVFISWFEGGEVFRSGCCFRRGKGRIFYFRPGHETYPIYHDPNVQKVLANAVRWCAPNAGSPYLQGGRHIKTPLRPLGGGYSGIRGD